MDLGHWKSINEVPDDFFGFIYLITNNITGRKYIGKKQSQSKRKLPPLKGKKKKRAVVKETDWRTYTGSCNELNDDIIKYGKENFTFEIMRFCNSKWELGYYEIAEQIAREVLLKSEYYNGIINCRLGKLKQYR